MVHPGTIVSVLESAELLVPSQVARILGVTINTLAMWRHRNQGPDYLKIGGRVRYDASDVDARFPSGVGRQVARACCRPALAL